MSTASSHRQVRRLLVAVTVGLLALLLAPAAAAHDVLVESSPAQGEELAQSPADIVLTFNNPPLEVGSVIAVDDESESRILEAEATVEGNDVVLGLTEPLAAGEYTVVWRVASSDGHPIEGQIPFTVAGSAEPTSQPPATDEAPETEAEPETEEAPATSEDTEDTEDTTMSEAAPETDEGSSGMPTWGKVVIAIAAVGAVAGLLVIVVRRLRSQR